MSGNHKGHRTGAQSVEQNEELRRRLEEAEQTLAAIHHGDVDGLVVAGPQGEQVYSLTGAEHVYRVIVETMNEAALTVDPNGTILFCNQRFCDLMKTPIQGAIGHKVTAFVAGPQRLPLQTLLADAQAGPVQRRVTLRAAEGTAVPVQLSASPLETGDSHSICLVASDLTELETSAHSVRVLREHQQALEESEARLALELAATQRLQEISTQLVQEEDAEALYDKILDAAVAIMRSDFASFQMLHPERGPGGELQLLGHRGFTPEAAQFWEWVRPTSESTCGIALRTGQRVITPDVQTLEFTPGSADRKTFLQTGIRAVQTTPLISRSGRLVGMISTHWRQPHRPTERDLRALDVLARQAADLIEHKQAQEALRNANEDLQAQAEQLQTANDLLQAKQHELQEANKDLLTQERELVEHAEALQASQERLALAASGTRIGMYEWNVATGETLWTEQVARLLGLRTTTTVSQSYHYQDWVQRVHPEDLPRVEAELHRCLTEQASYEAEYRVVWPDGSVHWIADRGIFQYESKGRWTRMLGILMDITERRQAEEALKIKENAIASSLNAIAMADPQGRLTYVNPAFLKLWGYKDEGEVLGKSVLDFWKEPEQALEVMRAIQNGQGWVGELVAVRKDGACLSLYLSASAVLNEAGTPTCVMASFMDITDRKHAEEALCESEFHLARAQEIAHLGSWSWDIVADRLYWSDEIYRLYGLQPGASVPRHEDFLGFVHPEDRPRVEQGVQEALVHGGSYYLDFRIIRRGAKNDTFIVKLRPPSTRRDIR